MVDNKYISCNTNTLKRSIGTIIKVTAMLRFVSDHLNPIQDGLFWMSSQIGGGGRRGGEGCKKAPSLKFVTHILQ